jgi:tRNA(Arg) A34 adenosine deaminase TadA
MPALPNNTDFDEAWSALELAFREAFELAWKSLTGGTIGVGSVITDAGGAIIARGRNRVYDAAGGDGLLQANRLGHAEMNALAEVPTDFSLADCTLWSTQQPCVLCSAAAVMSFIGNVRFLAADPIFAGIERMPELNDWLDRYWPNYEGPTMDDRWAVSAMLFQLYAAASRNPTGEVMDENRRVEPETTLLIELIVQERLWHEAGEAGRSANQALGLIWPQINAVVEERKHRLAAAREVE